jgi:hypothetical protein
VARRGLKFGYSLVGLNVEVVFDELSLKHMLNPLFTTQTLEVSFDVSFLQEEMNNFGLFSVVQVRGAGLVRGPKEVLGVMH